MNLRNNNKNLFLFIVFGITYTFNLIQIYLAENLTDPLVYTRLRFDRNYLQIYRKYNLKYPYEEKKVVLELPIITGENNDIKIEKTTFYESKEYDKSQLKQDDLILEALDRTYYTRLIQQYIYTFDNEEDRKRSSDPRLTSIKDCNRELDYLIEKLDYFTGSKRNTSISPELAAFYDSFANTEPGVLFGNIYWLGNWKQCSKSHIFDIDQNTNDPTKTYSFSGRYCVSSLRSPKWEPEIRRKADNYVKAGNYFKYPEQQYEYKKFFKLQIGICLPQSCDSNIIYERRNDLRELTTRKLIEPFKSYDLVDLYCLPDAGSELRRFSFSAKLFIVCSICWISLVICLTIVDLVATRRMKSKLRLKAMQKKGETGEMKQQQQQQQVTFFTRLVLSFSLIRNFNRFFSTKSLYKNYNRMKREELEFKKNPSYANDPQRFTMRSGDTMFLNALKAASIPLAVYGHCAMALHAQGRFAIDHSAYSSMYSYPFIVTAPYLVEWYFTITGIHTSYLVFSSNMIKKNTPFQWIYSIFKRYWRLAPTYIVIFWFCKSVFKYTSEGPLWDYGTSNITIRGICDKDSWATPLLMISNLKPLHESCIMTSWYASNDIQFYLITPILLVALGKSPLLGWLICLSIIFSSLILRIYTYAVDPRAQHLDLWRTDADFTTRHNYDMSKTYTLPHYRVSTYILGLLTGHYLYMVLSGKWSSCFLERRVDLNSKLLPTIGSPSGSGDNEALKNESSNFLQDKKEKIPKIMENNNKKARVFRTILWWYGVGLLLQMALAERMANSLPSGWDPIAYYFTTGVLGVHFLIVSLGMSCLSVGTMFGTYPRLRTIMSHPFWTIVAKINLANFLMQIDFFYYILHTNNLQRDMSEVNNLVLTMESFPLLIFYSFMLEIGFVSPLVNLEKEIFTALVVPPKRPPRPQQQQQQQQEQRGAQLQ